MNAIALLAGLLIFSEALKIASLLSAEKPTGLRFRYK
jgi:hypothetical protein